MGAPTAFACVIYEYYSTANTEEMKGGSKIRLLCDTGVYMGLFTIQAQFDINYEL